MTYLHPVEAELDGPHSFESSHGSLSFVFDQEAYDFHLDVAPTAKPSLIREALDRIQGWGLELLDDDECDPEFLADGRVRRYLTPTIAQEAEVLLPVQRQSLDETRREAAA